MINQLKAQGVQHISQLLPVSKCDMLLRSVRAPPQVRPTPYLGLYPGRYLSLSSPYLCPCLRPPAGASSALIFYPRRRPHCPPPRVYQPRAHRQYLPHRV